MWKDYCRTIDNRSIARRNFRQGNAKVLNYIRKTPIRKEVKPIRVSFKHPLRIFSLRGWGRRLDNNLRFEAPPLNE